MNSELDDIFFWLRLKVSVGLKFGRFRRLPEFSWGEIEIPHIPTILFLSGNNVFEWRGESPLVRFFPLTLKLLGKDPFSTYDQKAGDGSFLPHNLTYWVRFWQTPFPHPTVLHGSIFPRHIWMKLGQIMKNQFLFGVFFMKKVAKLLHMATNSNCRLLAFRRKAKIALYSNAPRWKIKKLHFTAFEVGNNLKLKSKLSKVLISVELFSS